MDTNIMYVYTIMDKKGIRHHFHCVITPIVDTGKLWSYFEHKKYILIPAGMFGIDNNINWL